MFPIYINLCFGNKLIINFCFGKDNGRWRCAVAVAVPKHLATTPGYSLGWKIPEGIPN